ncbi:hypothetical protein FRACYDRAFT_238561 [Fragilariopsis cylindrus CCMP1102]|uniref:RING-type domain-containing protein n=1 Tax=Fragilariopsis cylindrus CCMP1102 TaxID=635003 RepID=A0A1E7FJ01_9STRA|nr:hypothetical protein FRACYDRAFT_238561 [Fragilariopsis cylindrus CCMP1102]|eukprot:OEU18127.1 hypothetical protein FRACYDRAFT_238561 [Fragilariopsis cylindrus CCMP1102]
MSSSESVPPPMCAICLENLPGQKDYCKTSCGHEFHLSCMLTYGIYKKGALRSVEATSVMCPLCRKELHRRENNRNCWNIEPQFHTGAAILLSNIVHTTALIVVSVGPVQSSSVHESTNVPKAYAADPEVDK